MNAGMTKLEQLLEEKRKKSAIKKVVEKVDMTDMEQKVFNFIGSTKLIGTNGIPIEGATTVEVAQAFPDLNSSTLRYVIWHLRKKGKLVDNGLRRTLERGRAPVVVWNIVKENDE